MKLPAVAITAAFACGVALGLCPPISRLATSHFYLASSFLFAVFLVLAGIILLNRARLAAAAVVSGVSWILLGVLGAWICEQPLPPSHVTCLTENGRIDLHTPLRWRGTLRDEPAKLPWGTGLEIELAGVDYQNSQLEAQGGLRVSFSPRGDDLALPALHAGDEVSVIAQAKRPQVFRDEGVFDRRAYLATQGIDLVATLRSPALIERLSVAPLSARTLLSHTRHRLREEVDRLFDGRPEVAAVLRAMLLGDRSFVERDEAGDFQKTGVFHVLVVAGLHVGALALFLYWIGRKLRLSRSATMVFTLTLLFAYVAVIEQRPPVLRAALMATIVVLGGFFYRRLDVLNSAAIAALILLVAQPLALRDSSFQLTFLAIGCIAGLAASWIERNVQPYARALLSSHHTGGTNRKFGGCAAHRHCRAAGIPDAWQRDGVARTCQDYRSSAQLRYAPTSAHRALVCAFAEMELSDSGTAPVARSCVFRFCSSPSVNHANGPSAATTNRLGSQHGLGGVFTPHCTVSVCTGVVSGKA